MKTKDAFPHIPDLVAVSDRLRDGAWVRNFTTFTNSKNLSNNIYLFPMYFKKGDKLEN